MGVATVMILICHAEASNVMMPELLAKIFSFCNIGVDIFLLLSGLGAYYSMTKSTMSHNWGGYLLYYKKRFQRILVPYFLIYVPYCIVYMLIGKYSIVDSILCLSTLEYWLFHRGAWFVSLIIVLYLIVPLFYRCIKGAFYWLLPFCLIVIIMVLSNLEIY